MSSSCGVRLTDKLATIGNRTIPSLSNNSSNDVHDDDIMFPSQDMPLDFYDRIETRRFFKRVERSEPPQLWSPRDKSASYDITLDGWFHGVDHLASYRTQPDRCQPLRFLLRFFLGCRAYHFSENAILRILNEQKEEWWDDEDNLLEL